jgi:hypothetical protein
LQSLVLHNKRQGNSFVDSMASPSAIDENLIYYTDLGNLQEARNLLRAGAHGNAQRTGQGVTDTLDGE